MDAKQTCGRYCLRRDVTKEKKLEQQIIQSERLAAMGR